jgi:DNA-binding helix-hairpin-helix protein with protein kinase domain
LHAYGEPRWRRDHPVAGDDVVAALLALHTAIDRLHRAGVVIGDCNDLNVLVDGRRVWLIDVDSYQLAGFPCAMFSERFVDPRLCPTGLIPALPHDAASDWFAFAVMVFRALLFVSPWGGVTRRATGAARVIQRITVYASDVTYPRAARPLATLPDELTAVLRAIFERDDRGIFPRGALEGVQFRRCAQCGDEHARMRCPACQTRVVVPPEVVHGRLRAQLITADAVELAGYEVTARTPVWLEAGAL